MSDGIAYKYLQERRNRLKTNKFENERSIEKYQKEIDDLNSENAILDNAIRELEIALGKLTP